MEFNRSTKIISILVLVAFALTFGLPLQQVSALESVLDSVQTQEKTIQYEEPETTTNLGLFAEKLSTYIISLRESLEKGDLKQFEKDLKTAESALKTFTDDVSKELAENGKKIDELKATAAKTRQIKFEAELKDKLSAFGKLFEEADEIYVNGSIEDLKIKVDQIYEQLIGEQPEQTLGKSLPHNNVSMDPVEPVLGNESSTSYMSTGKDTVSSSLPETPVKEDLAETPETTLDQKAKELADSLDTPVKVYEYVRNNIDFEPYYGSRKGAVGTFSQLTGNDFDQASLLIAMLRYKGIPARYVKGTVEVPIEEVMDWTGAKTPEASVKVLGMLGNPTASLVSAGEIVAVRTEHVWVEAYVPYSSHNRVGIGRGNKIWVPLDASFKQYTDEEGLNIQEITGFTEEQILENFKIDGSESSDGDAITDVNVESVSTYLDGITEKIEQYVKDNKLENADAAELTGGKKIVSQTLGMLPLSLPNKVLTTLSKTNTISNADCEKIGFSIRGNDPYSLNFSDRNQFNAEFKAIELYGKRVTLSWAPATEEDKKIIKSYGGLYETPAYMIELKPQVKVDGKVVAEGSAVGFGNRQEFTISMGHAGSTAEKVTNTVTAGGIYCISFDYGKIDVDELQSIKDKVSKIQDTATEESIYTDEVMGEILNSVGKAYFAQLDGINSIIENVMDVSAVRQVSEAITGYQPKVKYMFGAPVEIDGGSFYIDVDHDVFGVTSLEGNNENEIGYMTNSGVIGSAMEHVIHEQVFKVPSVSTIKMISEANSRGIPIYSIAKDNIDKLDEIKVSSTVKTDFLNAVNGGKIVIIPQEEMNYYKWQGTGYIVLDPETGAAGYMISGGTAGGSTAETVLVTLIGLASLVFAIIDVVTIAMAFIAATNPILMVIYFSLYIVSVISVLMTLNDLIMYWQTGNYEYARDLALDLFLNLATMGVFKIIEKIVPGIKALFKGLLGKMDEVVEFQAKHGDEVAEAIVRMNGEEGLKHADELIDGLKGTGVADDVVENIAKRGGNEALEEASELITKYGDDAAKAINNGISPDMINKLDDLGIKPSDFDNLKINTSAAADAVEAAVKEGSPKTYKEFVDAAGGKYASATDASDSYIALVKGESPWPEGFTPNKTTLKSGDTFEMALDNAQPVTSPGNFATPDNITGVDYVRNQLAVKSNWKTDCGKVVEYRVKDGVEIPVATGPVGPQIDLNADKYLPGGGNQIQLLLDRGVDKMDYIEVVSVRSIN
ncbi:transglutaminase domain-containing protein [Acetivibrio cellulolyticus]|uniref:transglutaminase domain-containing protein n=1 Tax=Acetivibrio cellulolyticus TaxID=35830 RepID=UPI0001E2E695|nr:transglutaminase domain-containing protein [Acetivibrio cellulolyticus]